MPASRSILVAIALLLGAPFAHAAGPADRFTRVPVNPDASPNAKLVFTPLGVGNAMTTVVVELAGDPVTVAQAKAAAAFTKGQKEQLRDQLRATQIPVENELRARGGRVLGNYQHAYNGVKVRIEAGKARELKSIPGVLAVHPLQLFKPDNTHGVPLVGGPAVWGGSPAFHGEGIKVAIIDTGIDYTHADFGGPGTAAAYTAAHATETAAANPTLFGAAAPKVKGGIDLVGDSYNADPTDPAYQPVPHPDSNPLDCHGHGSHVAGTAAGFGVLDTGKTYTGAYDATTISSNSWFVGPGVAPKADLYAVRVFGCGGSTDVTVDAIEWAVVNGMDVINMSLGSLFGSADEPSAVASTNAAKAGVIVVCSAGNSGPNPYLTGSPGTGAGAISVAASDPTASFPGANLAFSTGTTLQAINANGASFSNGTTLDVVVLKTNATTISLGCNPADYTAAGVAGKVVVVRRGTCARVARAVFGQKAGAAAVVMLNNDPAGSLPPFEGPITRNPDTGEAYTVTIPFFGVALSTNNRAALLAANGKTVTLNGLTLTNSGFRAMASFSSGGPRTGDSGLKPEVTAPGVSIFSAGIGTGFAPSNLSGTSMAAPHTTGVAALVRQAHSNWKKVQYWKAAIVNTADPAGVLNYTTRNSGTGLVQAQLATATQVVALTEQGGPVLNFGFAELDRDFRGQGEIKLKNLGNKTATFDVTTTRGAGSAHSLTLRSTRVTVGKNGEAEVEVQLSVPAATAGDSSAFSDVAGLVTFTPVGASNNGITLNVPYYLVPQAVSHIATRLGTLRDDGKGTVTGTATVTNRRGVIAGNADWYAWGLSDRRDKALKSNDLRAVGAQSFPTDQVLAFGVSTNGRWSNPTMNEFDIFVDADGDKDWDYLVVATDLGAVMAGSFNGVGLVAVYSRQLKSDPKKDRIIDKDDPSLKFLTDAPLDSNTMALPVLFSQLCKANTDTAKYACLAQGGRITYWVESFGLTDGTKDTIAGTATFNPFSPALSTGMFNTLAPDASVTQAVSISKAEFAQSPALGFMIISHDNVTKGEDGESEVQLIGLSSEDDKG
jgi:subtilisin family serine protease